MMEAVLFLLLGVVLPMVIAYRLAPTRGRLQLGFMLLGWLGVIILLCMKPDPAVAAAAAEKVAAKAAAKVAASAKVAAPKVYTPADYRRTR